jgi:hypothetical protein
VKAIQPPLLSRVNTTAAWVDVPRTILVRQRSGPR